MFTLRRVTIVVFIINLFLTFYTAYVFFIAKINPKITNKPTKNDYHYNEIDDWNPWGSEFKLEKSLRPKKSKFKTNVSEDEVTIEIWGKAAIGFYLWENILKGKIDKKVDGGVYVYGFKRIDNYKFKFRSGPLLTVNSLKQLTVSNLILVLNGRDKDKIAFTLTWLSALKTASNVLKNVGVILLGDEKCNNNWIQPYLVTHGGPIKFLFVVYDWKRVDDDFIFQWPLGVATYRNFPNPDFMNLNLHITRPYVCNFIATIYPGSSREELIKIMDNDFYRKICFIKSRSEWQPKETKDSSEVYIDALRLSDLTLSPIGMNHECYRIFEAASYGSVPVLEVNLNHLTKTNCHLKSTYRLFKQFNAPFIYISNWTSELPQLIKNELKLSLEDKINRRIQLVKWYYNFKNSLKNKLLDVIDEKFFNQHF